MYAIISETHGLIDIKADELEAEHLAIAVAVNTGRTAYVKCTAEMTA